MLPIKNIKTILFSCFISILFITKSIAQVENKKISYLTKDYIIENNNEGIPSINNRKVLYWTKQSGLSIYFHKNGITFKQNKRKQEGHKKESINEEKDTFTKWSINFENGNVNKIIPKDLLSHYNCIYNKENDDIINIKNSTYKSIIYQDIWPNIDIKFYLKSNKSGLKYDIILKPGADSRNIAFSYDNATIKTNNRGQLLIETSLGIFTDQAPQSINITKDKEVSSQFKVLNKTLLNFSIGKYNSNDTIIIDPWIVSPISYEDWAKEIDFDFDGNSYVILADGYVSQDINYGPVIINYDIDYEVAKYNSQGVLQWTIFFYERWPGDLTVSKSSGEIYVSNFDTYSYTTPNPNDALYRIDNSGTILSIYTYGSPDNNEFIRLKFDDCNNELIVGTGGTMTSSNIGTVNSLLTSYNSFNICGSDGEPSQDVCNMALDPDGSSAYFFVGESAYYPHVSTCNQNIFKVPLGGLSPTIWSSPSTYWFTEYAKNNGMTCGKNYLYTYNGDTLFQWDKSTGAYLNTVNTGGNTYVSGGLDIETCSGNLFVGAGNSIKVYDDGLNLINSYNLPGDCIDLALNQEGKLFVCGENFVSEIEVTQPTIISSTNDTCNICLGTATVEGCFANTASFLWTPSGQTSQTAINLCQGWHKVNVIDNGTCNNAYNYSLVDSVYVDNNLLTNCDEKIDLLLHIPNTFTPNNDNENDLFKITVNGEIIKEGGDLVIFNRWGNKVYQSTDKMQWDGGKNNSGVYYYIFKFNKKEYKGNITLFK